MRDRQTRCGRRFLRATILGVGLLLAMTACSEKESAGQPSDGALPDGQYRVEVELTGGSGRATVESPALLAVQDGALTASVVWSSDSYDYMVVGDETYFPVNETGNSTFEIPVAALDEAIPVTADTTAMGAPHEIEYTLTFFSDGLVPADQAANQQVESTAPETPEESQAPVEAGSVSSSLVPSGSMELAAAREFTVDYYEGGYAVICIHGTDRYLAVPAGAQPPEDLAEDVTVIRTPIENTYLAASAVMDMFVSLDALDTVCFSSLSADSWYLDVPKRAMEAGEIRYAGKYSEPDYEQIVAADCGLAIESTMIYHTPEVKERLEQFGVPVLVDYSSYETEPLGRTEWVKLYGLLTGRQEEAEAAWAAQQEAFSQASAPSTGKTVAFFYITASGEVNVRKPSDYLAKMIGIAGGTYLFDDLGDKDDTASSTMSLQMEEFYAAAKNADYMIYNSTIEGELSSVEELLQKSPLLAKCKAVEDGNVYCTTKNIYQSSMALGTILTDLHHIIAEDGGDLTYLYRLD